jgi:hypothetical protein
MASRTVSRLIKAQCCASLLAVRTSGRPSVLPRTFPFGHSLTGQPSEIQPVQIGCSHAPRSNSTHTKVPTGGTATLRRTHSDTDRQGSAQGDCWSPYTSGTVTITLPRITGSLLRTTLPRYFPKNCATVQLQLLALTFLLHQRLRPNQLTCSLKVNAVFPTS